MMMTRRWSDEEAPVLGRAGKRWLLVGWLLSAWLAGGCGDVSPSSDLPPGDQPGNTPGTPVDPGQPGNPQDPGQTAEPAADFTVFKSFITRQGDRLMDGENEFRFVGLHATELHRIENDIEGSGHFRWPTAWEQESWIKSLVAAGHTASRIYVFSVQQGSGSADAPVHVLAPGKFNEDGFRTFDRMLQLLNRHGLRVIVPLVDNWQWWGGIGEYAAFRGKSQNDFFTDLSVRADFKKTIEYVLNRKNSLTGIKYKDDKAILAWETGNELRETTAEWLKEIAATIKQNDPNHLLLDGTQVVGGQPIKDHGLNEPNVDMVCNHYYGSDLTAQSVQRDAEKARGKKVFLVGEFGLPPLDQAQPILSSMLEAIVSSQAAGGLVWGFRGHRREGGFYYHGESNATFSYHLPGFPENDSYKEKTVVELVREYQAKIRKQSVAPLPAPEAPRMLPVLDPQKVSWLGSPTGRTYDLERSTAPDGPWTVIGQDLSDGKNQFQFQEGLFKDATAKGGQTYYYRVRAKNESGVSGYSQPVKLGELATTAEGHPLCENSFGGYGAEFPCFSEKSPAYWCRKRNNDFQSNATPDSFCVVRPYAR